MGAAAKLIHIKTDRPAFQMQVLAACFIIIGVVSIATAHGAIVSLVIGAVLIIAGILTIAVHTDLYLDTAPSLLVTCWKSLFFKHQTIQKLPEIQHVAVVRVHTHRTLNLRSISSFQEGIQYNVNLIFGNEPKRYKTLLTAEREEALALAMEIAEALQKPLLEHTTQEKHWLLKP